jgi:ATP-dependent helicase/DNAse subunit B
MLISHLSASSIKNFDMCNFAYYLSYICKLKGFQNEGALKGTIFHSVMEDMAHLVLKNKTITKEAILGSLEEHWKTNTEKEKEWCNLKGLDKDWCIKNLFKICLDKGTPFDYNVLGIEKEFDLTFDFNYNLIFDDLGNRAKELDVSTYEFVDAIGGDIFRIFGFMDLIIEKDKDTISIIDYKTAKQGKTQEESQKDIQFLIYDLACKYLYPQYKNREIVIYYFNDKTIRFTYKEDQWKKTLRVMKDKWIEISSCEEPKQTISNANRYWKCDFCAFRGEKNEDGKYKGGKKQCDKLCWMMSKGNKNINMEKVFEQVKTGKKI